MVVVVVGVEDLEAGRPFFLPLVAGVTHFTFKRRGIVNSCKSGWSVSRKAVSRVCVKGCRGATRWEAVLLAAVDCLAGDLLLFGSSPSSSSSSALLVVVVRATRLARSGPNGCVKSMSWTAVVWGWVVLYDVAGLLSLTAAPPTVVNNVRDRLAHDTLVDDGGKKVVGGLLAG